MKSHTKELAVQRQRKMKSNFNQLLEDALQVPLDKMLGQSIGKANFVKQTIVPPAPMSGIQGGNYGAQLKPIHRKFFGGKYGR